MELSEVQSKTTRDTESVLIRSIHLVLVDLDAFVHDRREAMTIETGDRLQAERSESPYDQVCKSGLSLESNEKLREGDESQTFLVFCYSPVLATLLIAVVVI